MFGKPKVRRRCFQEEHDLFTVAWSLSTAESHSAAHVGVMQVHILAQVPEERQLLPSLVTISGWADRCCLLA
eukprot:1062378-Amphidinium_carterae.1